METNILGTIVPLDLYIDININRQSIFSAEYHRDNLQIIGEYLSYDYDADIYLSLLTNTPFDKMKFKPEGYYSQIDYRFLSWLVIGAYYSNFYTDRTDKKGLKMSDFKNPDYFGWQKDTSLTLRFDFSNYWLLKIEAHYIDGTAQVSKFNNAEGTRRYWNLYAIKTTFNF